MSMDIVKIIRVWLLIVFETKIKQY